MIVYVIRNKTNGKCYVGQTIRTIAFRWSEHVRRAKQGCSFLLHRAIRKYGEENFRVYRIILCKNKRETDKIERLLISHYKKLGVSYNLASGGEGGSPFKGHKHKESSKRKIRAKLKGVKKPSGHGKKVSAALKGRVRTPEHNANLSGKNNGMFGRFGKLNPMFGKKRPDLAAFNRSKSV